MDESNREKHDHGGKTAADGHRGNRPITDLAGGHRFDAK